ncbi:hypothetical protein CsSME_00046217 [Camellia sinensis var. sinensis]
MCPCGAMHTATLWVRPLVISGWCGLTMSAFNMLPVGCLDGGRAIQTLLHPPPPDFRQTVTRDPPECSTLLGSCWSITGAF